jgi:hypothetical protein
VFNQARKLAIPLAVIAVAIVAVAFVNTARREAVRKANAAAYADLQKANEFDAPFEQDEKKVAENRKEQRAIYEKVLNDHGDSLAAVDARFRLAALELGAGNYAEAEKLFGELAASELSPLQTDVAVTGRANALVGLEKFDEAIAEYAKIAKKTDSTFAIDSSYRAAVVAYRKGDFAVAKQHLDTVLAADDAPGNVKRMAEQFLERLELFDAETVKASFVAKPKESAEDDEAPAEEGGDDKKKPAEDGKDPAGDATKEPAAE